MVRDQLTAATKDAMKGGHKDRLSALRMIQAEIKNADINNRSEESRSGVSEADIYGLLHSMIKKRRDAAQQYTAGHRPELAAKELAEIAVIEEFLPRQMNEGEMQAAVSLAVTETGAASIKDMGRVMAVLKERHAGQMDMGQAGQLVKQSLGAA